MVKNNYFWSLCSISKMNILNCIVHLARKERWHVIKIRALLIKLYEVILHTTCRIDVNGMSYLPRLQYKMCMGKKQVLYRVFFKFESYIFPWLQEPYRGYGLPVNCKPHNYTSEIIHPVSIWEIYGQHTRSLPFSGYPDYNLLL